MKQKNLPAPPEVFDLESASQKIAQLIYVIREAPVILDADVAAFYGRTTSAVNQQRSRNADRFPEAFAFQLSEAEWADLQSQFVISSSHGGRRNLPWAYTEHGFTMLAMTLRGDRAAHIAKVVIETFVAYRQGVLSHEQTFLSPDAKAQRQSLKQALYTQMQALATAELPSGGTFSSELKTITANAINSVQAIAAKPQMQAEFMIAEIRKLEAETAKLYAEAKKTNAEVENIWADVFQKRLASLAQLREMAAQLERDDVVDLLGEAFGTEGS